MTPDPRPAREREALIRDIDRVLRCDDTTLRLMLSTVRVRGVLADCRAALVASEEGERGPDAPSALAASPGEPQRDGTPVSPGEPSEREALRDALTATTAVLGRAMAALLVAGTDQAWRAEDVTALVDEAHNVNAESRAALSQQEVEHPGPPPRSPEVSR